MNKVSSSNHFSLLVADAAIKESVTLLESSYTVSKNF